MRGVTNDAAKPCHAPDRGIMQGLFRAVRFSVADNGRQDPVFKWKKSRQPACPLMCDGYVKYPQS